jgi:hypothetical protein
MDMERKKRKGEQDRRSVWYGDSYFFSWSSSKLPMIKL